MIHIKNKKEIESMRKGGKILAKALYTSLDAATEGVSEKRLDDIAEKVMIENGGEPGFKKVPGYHHAICTATNDVIVHGIPGDYRLKKGDVICIDAGVYLDNLHTDMAETIVVGGMKEAPKGVEKFLNTGKKALAAGIAEAREGNRVGHISRAIQKIVEGEGYSVVRSLIGHGVGRELHEEPEVPGYLHGPLEKTPLLKKGMTIAIEVIYAMGGPDVMYANDDGWTIKTQDGSISAVFERTILITSSDPEVLT
ncbi:MAG: type I methionyl aminopeptidase [Candidatus Levybacteria bacterium]|nr:type I methionyl aminopeptidase [Candidatus Levybacteria bacterium]